MPRLPISGPRVSVAEILMVDQPPIPWMNPIGRLPPEMLHNVDSGTFGLLYLLCPCAGRRGARDHNFGRYTVIDIASRQGDRG
jgi:hypothetical protein